MALARWKDLCIDAIDAHALAGFWGPVLGRQVERQDNGDAVLRGGRPEDTIWVNAVPEAKRVKHRVHLDLNAASIDPIVQLGATVLLPASESGAPWTITSSPGCTTEPSSKRTWACRLSNRWETSTVQGTVSRRLNCRVIPRLPWLEEGGGGPRRRPRCPCRRP